MIQTTVTITAKETIAPAWWQLTISSADLSPQLQPGQFLLLDCGDQCYLRRPIFPAHIEPDKFRLLLRPEPDPGLAWLLARQPGDELDVVGPLGQGFPLPSYVRNLLLISDSQTLGPLLAQMDRALRAESSVTVALGSAKASALYPLSALPPLVEVQAATIDGSIGHRGSVTALVPDLLLWADMVCAVGSRVLYHTLAAQVGEVRLKIEPNYLYGLITDYLLGCGVGACMSCALETEQGLKLTCVDGPVFDLTTLSL